MNETKLDFMDDLMNDAAKAAMRDASNWRTCSPDCPPCAMCRKIITGGCPLRAFNGDREIAFHDKCCLKEGTMPADPNEEVDGWGAIIECVVCEQRETCPHLSDEERKHWTVDEMLKRDLEKGARENPI